VSGSHLALGATAILALAAANANRRGPSAPAKGSTNPGDTKPDKSGAVEVKNPYRFEDYRKDVPKIEEELDKLKRKILDAESAGRYKWGEIRDRFEFPYRSQMGSAPRWAIVLIGENEVYEIERDMHDANMEHIEHQINIGDGYLSQHWVAMDGEVRLDDNTVIIKHELEGFLDETRRIFEDAKIVRSVTGRRLFANEDEVDVKTLFDNMNHILMCLQQRERLEEYIEELGDDARKAIESDEWWHERFTDFGEFTEEEIERAKKKAQRLGRAPAYSRRGYGWEVDLEGEE
jgi:hypothetical protein